MSSGSLAEFTAIRRVTGPCDNLANHFLNLMSQIIRKHHRLACRMVKAARDAWLSGALTQHSNRLSTKATFAVGKRNFPGQRQRPRNAPSKPIGRLQRRNACTNRRQFGAIRTEPGNPRLRRTTWWGWERCHKPNKSIRCRTVRPPKGSLNGICDFRPWSHPNKCSTATHKSENTICFLPPHTGATGRIFASEDRINLRPLRGST
jgi:hypothetical protein